MSSYPFLRPEFFAALEDSGSAVAATGWQPCHQTLVENGAPQAFMPLYVKQHSYGEYVFDWAWADAYQRNGLNYYPKLLTAIPFTPATGSRVRFGSGAKREALAAELIERTLDFAAETQASGWHLLFPDAEHLALFSDPRLMHRKGVQYHWFNRNYHSFDDFLGHFNSRKRKMVAKERRQVAEQQLVIERFTGAEITADLWRLFALFYQRTYLKRSGSRGYLTPEFFALVGATMPEHCLLITARQGDQVVAAAFYLFDDDTLFGRYWGCLKEFDFLHFELCYYQGIEFAIARKLKKFDAGAQGEHKILRGFEPVVTHSLHWLAEPAFAAAVARFLREEDRQIEHHVQQAATLLPYKKAP
ncbi:MAG: GNAT family N-acetyltransferase [Porticoccaceae bacterium]|nr:GNAT family N-acetyltransferase [Porticoccaceae bacterium]